MLESLKKLIAGLREAPEPVRRRYLMVLSGISMILVIAFWAGYLNLIVAPVEDGPSPASVKEEQDFWKVLGAGFTAVAAEVRTTLGSSLRFLREQAGAENQITVKRPERNFILEGLEKVPKAIFP